MTRHLLTLVASAIVLGLIAATLCACESLQDGQMGIGEAGGAVLGGVAVATSVAAASATH